MDELLHPNPRLPDRAGGSHGGEEEPELAAVQASTASQIAFQVAVALQKRHGMCWGCVCVTELASKGQLQWKRGISLCAVYGDKPEPESWALGFRQLRAVHVERVTEKGTERLGMAPSEIYSSFVWPEFIKPPFSSPFCGENRS